MIFRKPNLEVSKSLSCCVSGKDICDITFNGVEWDEISTSLTLELVNNTIGNKFYTPESISLYAGPIFSTFISDDFSEDNDFGVVGGLEIFIVDTVIFDVEIQHFGQTSFSAGINFRF